MNSKPPPAPAARWRTSSGESAEKISDPALRAPRAAAGAVRRCADGKVRESEEELAATTLKSTVKT
jgi:hypothetical protein